MAKDEKDTGPEAKAATEEKQQAKEKDEAAARGHQDRLDVLQASTDQLERERDHFKSEHEQAEKQRADFEERLAAMQRDLDATKAQLAGKEEAHAATQTQLSEAQQAFINQQKELQPVPPKRSSRRFRVCYGAVSGFGIDAKGVRVPKDFYRGTVVTEEDLGGMAGHYLANGDGITPMLEELES